MRPEKPSMFRALDEARARREAAAPGATTFRPTSSSTTTSVGKGVAWSLVDPATVGLNLGAVAVVTDSTLLPVARLVGNGVNLASSSVPYVAMRGGLAVACLVGAAFAIRAAVRNIRTNTVEGSLARHTLVAAHGCALTATAAMFWACSEMSTVAGCIAALATAGTAATGVLATQFKKGGQ